VLRCRLVLRSADVRDLSFAHNVRVLMSLRSCRFREVIAANLCYLAAVGILIFGELAR
jgi:hypothetical protein